MQETIKKYEKVEEKNRLITILFFFCGLFIKALDYMKKFQCFCKGYCWKSGI